MRGESIIGIEGKQRTTLRVRLVAFVAAITLLGWANSVSVPVVSADSPCVDGWQQMPVAVPMTGSGAAASIDDEPAWWVGGSSAGKPQVMRWDGTEWRLVAVPLKQAGSLKAVSAVSSTLAWTVGYRHPLGPRPISARWDGTSWKSVFVPNPGGQTTLGSVAALPDGTAWAVGASLQQGQLHPVALHFNGTAWINKSPSVAVGEESGLLAVTSTAGGIWTAGWRSTQGSSAPWIASWNGSSWTTASLPDVGAQGIVTSLAFSSALDGWAAGYLQLSTGAYALIVLCVPCSVGSGTTVSRI